jgi:uncharacterized protein (UPF0548 family)
MGQGFFDKAQQAVAGSGQQKNYQLSTIGNQKLEKIEANGAEYLVMSAIKRHEPCTVDEVVRDSQLAKFTSGQIKDVMVNLKNRHWLTEANIGG